MDNAKLVDFTLQRETLDGYRVQRNAAARFTPPGAPWRHRVRSLMKRCKQRLSVLV